MRTITLDVSGMSCGHCVAAVTRALEKVAGVEEVHVSLESAEAVVKGSPDVDVLIEAVRDEGYEAASKAVS